MDHAANGRLVVAVDGEAEPVSLSAANLSSVHLPRRTSSRTTEGNPPGLAEGRGRDRSPSPAASRVREREAQDAEYSAGLRADIARQQQEEEDIVRKQQEAREKMRRMDAKRAQQSAAAAAWAGLAVDGGGGLDQDDADSDDEDGDEPPEEEAADKEAGCGPVGPSTDELRRRRLARFDRSPSPAARSRS